jgi:Mrp family chromosome partitioning ATPase
MNNSTSTESTEPSNNRVIDRSKAQTEDLSTTLGDNPGVVTLSLTATSTPPEFLHLYSALENNGLDIDGPSSVAFNGLAQDGLSQDRPFVLGVTSAIPGEGKTTTATHLALTMALNSYKRICLMDFSLSENSYEDVAGRLGLYAISPELDEAQRAGIIDVLEERAQTLPTFQMSDPENLTVVPRGGASKRPAKIARSPRIRQLLSSARHAFDVIIVDLPAVSTENALPLAKHCDGVLLVVQAGTTPRDIVQRAIDVLGKDRVVGVALNRQKISIPGWLVRLLRL